MAEEFSLDTRAEADATPDKTVRRWLLEISLAQKREKDWRKQARETIDVYRGKNRKKNSFNILWANTEVQRPALYNSAPKPDVRRRFRQEDKLGKAVSEVMERGVSYCVDAYDMDNCLQNDVLDALLPGRGLSRVRYVPKIKKIPAQVAESASPGAVGPAVPPPAQEPADASDGERDEVEYEQALCEHVQWDDFLHGPGKTWEEVTWVGFGHNLTRDSQIEKFGEEIAKQITLDDVREDELQDRTLSESEKRVFKTSRFWEIWDREGKRVFFVNESYRKGVIHAKDAPTGEPPLKLKNFFPVPRPLQLTEDTGTLIPGILYEMYREQAEELNRLSVRINKIINACRIRFAHDPALTELAELMKAGDNDGIPVENARMWLTNGGIDKAIWWMPVDKVAAVLQQLYAAREACKQVIYEITGLSDVLRGATDPNETLGAQQLKSNSVSLRLQRMKSEVQRYARDLVRLLAEVIGENFDPQTLAQMTGLQFPTAAQKQMVQLQVQAAQRMAQQSGQEPPPEVQAKMQQAQQALSMPSWEDIMAVLRSDMQREYRVDVETDSTVAQSLQQDMEGVREVLTGIVELWTGAGPAVQSGAVSIDVVKALTMTIARRARMGLEVEDALEQGFQQPPPPPAQEDNSHIVEQEKTKQLQLKEQATAQREQEQRAADQQSEAEQRQSDLQREQMASQEKVQLDAQAKAAEVQKHEIEMREKYAFEWRKIEKEAETKIEVAKISARASVEASEAKAELSNEKTEDAGNGTFRKVKPLDKVHESLGGIAERLEQLAEEAGATVSFERGADGRVAVVKKGSKALIVNRGADGRANGIGRLQ